MNKMNFYKLIEQQYEDYKIEVDMLSSTCDGCPCKTLRDKMFGSDEQTGCTYEMMHLIDKYKINGANAYLCEDCMIAAVKIAKKISENFNRI